MNAIEQAKQALEGLIGMMGGTIGTAPDHPKAIAAHKAISALSAISAEPVAFFHDGHLVWNKTVDASKQIDFYAQPIPSWEPKFDAISHVQEQLAIRFSNEIAGPKGSKPSLPDPVRLLEMAEALYLAEKNASPLPQAAQPDACMPKDMSEAKRMIVQLRGRLDDLKSAQPEQASQVKENAASLPRVGAGVKEVAGVPEGWIFMRHPSRFNGQWIPARVWEKDGVKLYMPWEENGCDLEWDKRCEKWEEFAAPASPSVATERDAVDAKRYRKVKSMPEEMAMFWITAYKRDDAAIDAAIEAIEKEKP